MKVLTEPITSENLGDIPMPCRVCLYWEEASLAGDKSAGSAEYAEVQREALKADWFLKMLKEFGGCGKLLFADGRPVGYVQYGLASGFPNAKSYGAKQLAAQDDIVFISCLYIPDESFRRRGFGGKLLKETIVELKDRGFKGIETFARRGSPNNPSGPIEFYLKEGFRIKEEIGGEFVLVRLEL